VPEAASPAERELADRCVTRLVDCLESR
jgi:hypothetical protein